MEKSVTTTGDHGIGIMIHVVHMTDDVAKLTRFYEDVFLGYTYMGQDEPNYLPVEDRWATLVMVGDYCVEVMAPNKPVNGQLPVGRFYTKFGQHLHSVGYKVDDLEGLGDRLISDGVYIGAPGGGKIAKMDPETIYFYPSPRDTAGLMVELCRVDMHHDPRLTPEWTSMAKMWRNGPLTIDRLAYVTLGVRDLEPAVRRYVDTMQAVPLHEGVDDEIEAAFQILHLGDCLLRLAQPLDRTSALGEHVEQWGNMIYSVTFRIEDIDSAERWLNSKGVRTRRLRSGLLAADPADTFGAPYFFTTESVPGDPFEN
jgi:catechol 2,3-dioxygenase-like lactoylglutathione lyase family enzyme